jgi:chemotaxis protein histidine kinase CheA
VITPPHALRKAITPATSGAEDPVARAEAALDGLAGEFAGWMHAECDLLEAARCEARREGMTKKTHNELFRAAHDIKGEAATFGYPAVDPVADSLCRLLEHTPDIKRIPLALVEQHVDAVRAIAREHARVDRAGVAHPAAARHHRRVPARREHRAAGLSRKHFRPAPRSRRGLSWQPLPTPVRS